MKTQVFALLVCLTFSSGFAQSPQTSDSVSLFKEPVPLLTAGKPFKGIMYPSPVLQDIDGDGTDELIVGDLPGRMRFAHRSAEGSDTDWAALQPMKQQDGTKIDLSNW